jgi:hypothetical protein
MKDTAFAEPAVAHLLSFQSCEPPAPTLREKPPPACGPPSIAAINNYLLQVQGHAMAQVLEAVVPALDRLLAEKMADVRNRKVGSWWNSARASWW